jgi:DNA-binding NarL/FixJ family response regulator
MARKTILYLSDEPTCSNSVLAALRAAGYDVLKTNGSTQAIALLFVMQSIAAVVLSYSARKQASFDEARNLRAICPNVPIVLMCRDQIDRVPPCVDAFVSSRQPLEKLATAVRCLLAGKRAIRCPRLSNFSPHEAGGISAGIGQDGGER